MGPEADVEEFFLLDWRQGGRHPAAFPPVGPAGIDRALPPEAATLARILSGLAI